MFVSSVEVVPSGLRIGFEGDDTAMLIPEAHAHAVLRKRVNVGEGSAAFSSHDNSSAGFSSNVVSASIDLENRTKRESSFSINVASDSPSCSTLTQVHI